MDEAKEKKEKTIPNVYPLLKPDQCLLHKEELQFQENKVPKENQEKAKNRIMQELKKVRRSFRCKAGIDGGIRLTFPIVHCIN